MAPPRVIWAELQHLPSGWRMHAHAHAEFDELVLVLQGRLRTTLVSSHTLGPGTAIIHPRARPHDHELIDGKPVTILYCSFTGCPELTAAQLVIDDRDGRIEAALRWITDLGQEGTLAGQSAAHSLLGACLHEFLVPREDVDSTLVRRAREHARAHLAQAVTLADLARASGFSRAYFSRRFRAATGKPPMRWLRDLRLATGRHLLATTSLTVEAVALQVGFSDRFQFARMMRQRSGRPPSGWRSSR
jgi:AraC-like DNA-binding protein